MVWDSRDTLGKGWPCKVAVTGARVEGNVGDGGAHIHTRYAATHEWFGINRWLLLFIVFLPMHAYTHSHSYYPQYPDNIPCTPYDNSPLALLCLPPPVLVLAPL